MASLILASTSRFRCTLLDRLAVPYEARSPEFEENMPEGASPNAVARMFAEGKARSLTAGPATWIIGADQVLDMGGQVLRKTESLEECKEQLGRLSGRTHALYSAVALYSPSERRMLSEVVTVVLSMRKLEPDMIERYVALDQPIGSAGGYLFEGRGIALFDEVRGGDESAIVGLPLMSLCRLLRRANLDGLLFTK